MRAMVRPRTRLEVGVSVTAKLRIMTRVGVRTRVRMSVSMRDSGCGMDTLGGEPVSSEKFGMYSVELIK